MTPTPDAKTRILHSSSQRAAYFDLRYRVFVCEQQVPFVLEIDARDFAPLTETIPVGIFHADELIAGARILINSPTAIHIGRVVVERSARGHGLGSSLIQQAEVVAARALRNPAEMVIELDAQTRVIPFYESLGFHAYGPEFDDAGIPHRTMRKIRSSL
ncbi:MAG: GNAT family N-acetyltransferase [Actinomycetaceae bacterium]|nr:GNAT family N-acetyltransferase [Actinomycetaceae bacterium]